MNEPIRFDAPGTFWNLADSIRMIQKARSLKDHPDRGLQVEEAIAPEFDRLATEAEHRGWTVDETAHALLNLAVARICAIDANLDTDEALARTVRSVHGLAFLQTTARRELDSQSNIVIFPAV